MVWVRNYKVNVLADLVTTRLAFKKSLEPSHSVFITVTRIFLVF